ncbi:MAG: hypothetical protein EA416_02985, partial [Trueperaceae bacterium]
RVAALRDRGATVLVSDDGRGRPSVPETLTQLADAGALSLLLEGGGTLAWSFTEARALDRVAWFVAPKLLGGTAASPLGGLGVATMDDALTLTGTTVRDVGDDLLIEGDVHYPSPGDVRDSAPAADQPVQRGPVDGED